MNVFYTSPFVTLLLWEPRSRHANLFIKNFVIWSHSPVVCWFSTHLGFRNKDNALWNFLTQFLASMRYTCHLLASKHMNKNDGFCISIQAPFQDVSYKLQRPSETLGVQKESPFVLNHWHHLKDQIVVCVHLRPKIIIIQKEHYMLWHV